MIGERRTDTDDPKARGLPLVAVLLTLTAVSGLIDAVTYLGIGRIFTANMTGNVVVLGFAAAGAPGFSVPHAATSLGTYLAGAVTGGRIAVWLGEGSRRTWARVTLAVEAALMGAASVVAYVSPGHAGTAYALIILTALAMGLRNATVRRLGVPDLTTTVLTMTLTGLAAESRVGGGSGTRSAHRTGAVVAMLAGAVVGAWLVIHHGLAVPLLVAAATTAALAATTAER
ncbi:YoaK family protein [Streptomyces sp. NPDC052682]|uniref:YoaK family protein n=1 Tax=Streptomyces sp. NPDC052682 TaxID=3154954 RepID=UPI00343E1AD4